MIVEMRKFLIYGAKEQMDRFFSLAQRAGFLEFIGIWHKKALEMPQHVKSILSAIKILRQWMGSEHGIELAVLSNPVILAERVVQLNTSLERNLEEQRVLTAEIARIAPFGDFAKSDIAAIEKEGHRVIQFFCMKSDLAHDVTLPPEILWVGSESDLDYYVAINEDRKQYPKMIEIHIDTPLGDLKNQLQDVEIRIAGLEAELKCLAVNLPFLQEGLADSLNEHHLESAKHDASFPMGDAVFAIEAWVPATRVKGLLGLLSGLSVYSEPIAIEPNDRVPTCIENAGTAKIGEDLVGIYDTPSVSDRDPSLWVLVFFSVFFAMIVSDAGYGLLYLALGLFLKWKFPHLSGKGKRFIKLTMILASFCIVWGVLTTSFFGIQFAPDSPFRKISLVDYLVRHKAEYILQEKGSDYASIIHRFPEAASAVDGQDLLIQASKEKGSYPLIEEFTDSLMMEVSLLMGIFHLSLSFGRYLRRHLAGLGWIVAMIGGYLFLPAAILHTTTIAEFMGWISEPMARTLGANLLIVGAFSAIVLSIIQHGFNHGIAEALHVTTIFGDILSYLRLYALGLAGLLMATTFNAMGVDFGLGIGIFIILLGHLANIGIGIMAGTIHGLRLNFLEWYHYCFVGGGKLFNPLQLRRPKI